MRVALVTGSRHMDDIKLMDEVLDFFYPDIVIHGAAKGADILAANWAVYNEKMHIPFPANWDKHGKPAGIIRNRDMCEVAQRLQEYGHEVKVFAFPAKDSIGTIHCISYAKAVSGLSVTEHSV